MTFLWDQAPDDIIAEVAAAIEGTGSYTGIPGVFSHDELLSGTQPSALTITATGGTAKNTIEDTSRTYASDRWTATRAPSFWLACATATNAENVGAARKISAWTQASTTFTTANFPANITAADTFYVLEGFRHVVDGGGEDVVLDRRFTVEVEPGESIDLYGSGYSTTKGTLLVSLSLDAANKSVSSRRAAFTNGEILRHSVARRDNWESTYVQAVFLEGSKINVETEDDGRSVVEIRWPIHYRLSMVVE